jgi:DNA-binding response OmpR family regulator
VVEAEGGVVVLADDLIWATRLATQLQLAGVTPVHVRTVAALKPALSGARAAIVDLTARAYDGVAAVRTAAEAGLPVLAVGQHDDQALRREALSAGADRVYAYRKLFEAGPDTLSHWLASQERRRRG